ncbi:uncharacterized protein LOC9300229 [Arabidopsis lyrata subsp. lyrata]|uniref:uncharacterized protein LOC9300229 n=1 Tax=Arabidopsis lyrata subsp. lyrata TaxID=81972 RepID=UPI000A29C4CD|nr:uncharacterized protein LOC9300229 [Arabidopsis lyrata subsp. lyrata]|eukprot:XP_002864153.2 uncharacterized protein LOC9300229 [Arabidopsis lyrata subsp. lyrata]
MRVGHVGYAESMNVPLFRRRIIRGSFSWALFLCLLTLTLCVAVGASTTTTTTSTTTTAINSPDGDIIDCTEILAQPAFRHPLLKDHKLQEVPRNLPNTAKNEDGVSGWQIWNSRNGSKCPEGTIPIRRVVSQDNGDTNEGTIPIRRVGSQENEATNSGAEDELTRGHEYAIAHLNSTTKIYGTKVTMSVGHPKVAQPGEFSLGQLWLTSGSVERGDMNTIEAGWQIYPSVYLDDQPRLFIFWTNDAYTIEKCENLRRPGFIQTSGNVLVEGAIHPHTEVITIQIWKDPNLGHWWLSVGPNSGTVLIPVGYWPREIFTCLTDHAESVQWGGEIIDKYVSGQHTTTQMGSGYLPSSAKAAYMRDLEIMVNTGNFQPAYDLVVGETNPDYYNIKKTSDTSFSYGGPESGACKS